MSELRWNSVSDGLPLEYGDYLVVRENSEIHDVTVAVTNFHPKRKEPWFDKGFIYLYWIGPVLMPKELAMVGCWTKKYSDSQDAQR